MNELALLWNNLERSLLENDLNDDNKQNLSYFRDKYKSKVANTLVISQSHPYLEELKSFFDKHLVSQEQAKKELADSVLDSVLKIWDYRWPLGVFFFHGPTWVWKTEIVKALAENMFWDPNAFIKINCENFADSFSGTNLFWSPKWYIWYDDKTPFTNENITRWYDSAKKLWKLNKVLSKMPWINILLFDEIEKAHPKIIQSLLWLIDEWKATNSKWEVLNFQNSIIIFTSNVGQEEISKSKNKNHIWFNSPSIKEKDGDKNKIFLNSLKSHFKPEFIWRIDRFIEFNELSKDDCKKIIEIELNKFNKYLIKYFNQCFIQVELSPNLVEEILEKWYSKEKWARELVRNYNNIVSRYVNKLLHSNEFNKYFDYKWKVIIWVDLDKDKNLFSEIILESKLKNRKNKLLTLEQVKTWITLDKLENMYWVMSAYLWLVYMDLDGNIDLKDEIGEYVEKLKNLWLSINDIALLKNRVFIDRLNEMDYISDFSWFDINKDDDLFYPYDIKTIKKVVYKKMLFLNQNYDLSNRQFKSMSTTHVLKIITDLLKVEELSREQINIILIIIRKTIVEHF